MKIAFNPSTVEALKTPPNNKDITFDLKGQNIFARGVKFCGTDTWRPVVDNLTSDSTTSSLSANQGKILKGLIDGKSNTNHTHGLSNSVFFLNMPNISENAKWKDAFGYSVNSQLLASVRINNPAPEWCAGNFGSGILYGGFDTKGFMSSAWKEPFIMWASGNGHTDDSVPNWYIGIKGTHKSIYNLTTIASEAHTAYNLRHSHSNKSVLDGITTGLVTNWNTAYNFVNTITGTDTDNIINKWDEIVNFLAGITEDNKLNTLLNSKLSVYELVDNTNVGAIKNNGIYYSTSDASSSTLTNSPFRNGFALINMTSINNGNDLRRSRLAFNAFGEIKVSDDRSQASTEETWHTVLTSKNYNTFLCLLTNNNTTVTRSEWKNPFYTYDKNNIVDGQAICIWGQAATKYTDSEKFANDSGDISLWLKRINANTATMNMVLDGEYYACGNQRLAHVTELPTKNSWNYDDRYVKKTGDVMSGKLTITTTGFGTLIIKRNDDTNGASIQFRGKSSVYGYIGLNNNTKDKQFLRYSSDGSKIYTILDTSSTYISNGKGIINGSTITQVDNADKLDGYHASGLLTTLSNSNRGISLTVGGTTKSLSNIDADTVDGEHASAFTRIVGRYTISTNGTAPYKYIHLFRIANSKNYSTVDCEIDFRTRFHSAKLEIRIVTSQYSYGANGSSISIIKKVINGRSCNLWVLQTVQSSGYNYYDIYYQSTSWDTGTYDIILRGSNGVLVFEHKGTNIDTLPDNVSVVNNQWVMWNDIAEKPSSFNPAEHNHDTRYVRAFGTSNDNIDSDWGESFKTFDPVPSGTPPEQSANISLLSIGANFRRRKQLAFIYNNDNIYYRRHVNETFTNWQRIAFVSDIPSSLKNPHPLLLKANGTVLATYDGSSAKEANFTYANVGAASASHNHDGRYVKIWGSIDTDFNFPDNGDYSGVYACHASKTQSNKPLDYGLIANFSNNNGHLQFFGGSNNVIYTRSYWWTKQDNFKYTNWCTLLHSGNSSISGNTIKINNTSLTVANSNHNHDDVYLKLAGGTMNSGARISVNGDLYIGDVDNNGFLYLQDIASQDGEDNWTISTDGNASFYAIEVTNKISVSTIDVANQIKRPAINSSWVAGRDNALLRDTSSSGYHALWSLKTTNGSWEFGEYNNPNWYDVPVLSYITDTDHAANNNSITYQIKFPLASGTVALTSNIPDPTDYYWANIKVSASSNTQTKPSVNTIYANNWFRSQGSTGWYSEDYGGGIYMTDSSWVKVFNDKGFYTKNIIKGTTLQVEGTNQTVNVANMEPNLLIIGSDTIINKLDTYIRGTAVFIQSKLDGSNHNTVRISNGKVGICTNPGTDTGAPFRINGSIELKSQQDNIYFKQPICIAVGRYYYHRSNPCVYSSTNTLFKKIDVGHYQLQFPDIPCDALGVFSGQLTNYSVFLTGRLSPNKVSDARGDVININGYLGIDVYCSDDTSLNDSSFSFIIYKFDSMDKYTNSFT